MGKHIRMTALLLTVCILLNMVVLPVRAEDTSVLMEQLAETEGIAEESSPASDDNLAEGMPEEEVTVETVEETVEEIAEETVTESAEETVPETTAETAPETTEATVTDETTEETVEETVAEMLLDGGEQDATEENLLLPANTIAEQEQAGESQTASLPPTEYLYETLEDYGYTAGQTEITIKGGPDLIRLSYLAPQAYQNLTLNLVNTDSAGYITTGEENIEGKPRPFQGLGSEEYPFQGKIVVLSGSQNSPIKLNMPLFRAVDDSAVIGNSSYSVMLGYYMPQGATQDLPSSLLAAKVTHMKNGGETWHVSTVVPSGSASQKTPPLIDELGVDAKISLLVKNTGSDDKAHTAVTAVEGNGDAGYLCASMAGGGQSYTGKLDEHSDGESRVWQCGRSGGNHGLRRQPDGESDGYNRRG